MGTLNRIDVKAAIFLKRCLNSYIKKRTYSPLPPTQDEIWESLFLDNDHITFTMNNDINIVLFKESLLSKLIYFGFEEIEIEFVKKYLKKGDTFFDIGANIGLYSLLASSIIGEKGKVFAFEPTPISYERLKDNIQLNGMTNIIPINLGISNNKSIIDLYVYKDGRDAWNSFASLDFKDELDTIKVNVDTIDSILTENKIEKVDLLKVDVEGWEKYVLEGSINLIKKKDAPVFMIEFTEENAFAAGYYLGDVFDFMRDYGYNWYSYNAEQNSLIKEKKKLHYIYENLIAIKNINDCLNRIS